MRSKIFDIPEKEVFLQRYKQKKNVTEFTKHPIAALAIIIILFRHQNGK